MCKDYMNIYNNLFSALDNFFAHPTWGMVSSSNTGNNWFVKLGHTENRGISFSSDAFYINFQLPGNYKEYEFVSFILAENLT